MTRLGEVLLNYYAGASNYADQAIVAAVEELEKAAGDHPGLVGRVEMAILKAGQVGIPYEHLDEFQALAREMGEI